MMKTISCSSLLILCSFAMVFLAGCGAEKSASSMTEGVSLSEIEAYEKAQREMLTESAAEMEADAGDATKK